MELWLSLAYLHRDGTLSFAHKIFTTFFSRNVKFLRNFASILHFSLHSFSRKMRNFAKSLRNTNVNFRIFSNFLHFSRNVSFTANPNPYRGAIKRIYGETTVRLNSLIYYVLTYWKNSCVYIKYMCVCICVHIFIYVSSLLPGIYPPS